MSKKTTGSLKAPGEPGRNNQERSRMWASRDQKQLMRRQEEARWASRADGEEEGLFGYRKEGNYGEKGKPV